MYLDESIDLTGYRFLYGIVLQSNTLLEGG